MFHQAELRMLAGALILFLAGLGWRGAHASAVLPPLSVGGTPLEWADAPESEPSLSVLPSEVHATPVRKVALAPPSGPIDPNTATRSQLESLPGVGPSLAGRILEARAASPLRSLADLDRIKGIGPAKLEKLRPLLIF